MKLYFTGVLKCVSRSEKQTYIIKWNKRSIFYTQVINSRLNWILIYVCVHTRTHVYIRVVIKYKTKVKYKL